MVFDDEFIRKFPLLAEKLACQRNQQIFLNTAKFIGYKIIFFAEIIETLLYQREINRAEYILIKAGLRDSYHQNNPFNPRHPACMLITVIAVYTQFVIRDFRQIFLPGLIASGASSDGFMYFDWRSEEARSKDPKAQETEAKSCLKVINDKVLII